MKKTSSLWWVEEMKASSTRGRPPLIFSPNPISTSSRPPPSSLFQGSELEETELSLWFTKNHVDVNKGKVVVKPARAGSSIGVTVAYVVADSLTKANAIMSEELLDLSDNIGYRH